MHRNTFILVSILAVIAALLIGVNIGRNMGSNQRTESPSPTPVITPKPTTATITKSTCGIIFQYPNSLQLIESSGSGIILANTAKPDDSVVITCQEDIPRIPLAPEKIETFTIKSDTTGASVSAKLYHDASQKDGTPVDKLIFTHPTTQMDVFIAGFGATFQQLLATLKLE